MRKITFCWRTLLVGTLALTLASCAIVPKSGPTTSAVVSADGEQVPDSLPLTVIDVTNSIANQLFQGQQQQNFSTFAPSKQANGSIGPGDVVQVILWEASPAILFATNSNLASDAATGSQAVTLPGQMVDYNGYISVPFVGRVSVAGKTPQQVQANLVARLNKVANQPQVLVQVTTNNSENVTVLRQGNSVRMPLTAHGERVLDAVAVVGGVDAGIQDISVQLTRQGQVKTISLASLVTNPQQNVRLEPGDIVYLLTNPLSFTAMGAVGKSQEVNFSAQGLSLAQALARVEGLNDNLADPKGLFVFRYVNVGSLPVEQRQKWLSQGYTVDNSVPTIYRLNLKDPQAMFWLQKFPIQDKDVVYVSNAPFAEFSKFVRSIYYLINPTINLVNSINEE